MKNKHGLDLRRLKRSHEDVPLVPPITKDDPFRLHPTNLSNPPFGAKSQTQASLPFISILTTHKHLNHGRVDPSNPEQFGCACATPDGGDANLVIVTGGPRNIQLGIKMVF